jgi:hypothetical protein
MEFGNAMLLALEKSAKSSKEPLDDDRVECLLAGISQLLATPKNQTERIEGHLFSFPWNFQLLLDIFHRTFPRNFREILRILNLASAHEKVIENSHQVLAVLFDILCELAEKNIENAEEIFIPLLQICKNFAENSQNVQRMVATGMLLIFLRIFGEYSMKVSIRAESFEVLKKLKNDANVGGDVENILAMLLPLPFLTFRVITNKETKNEMMRGRLF